MHWIPTKERVPDKKGTYLVTRVGGYLDLADYFPENEYETEQWYLARAINDYTTDEITAWAELPEPYRGEEK